MGGDASDACRGTVGVADRAGDRVGSQDGARHAGQDGIGNFGDGTINAFDPISGASLGALADASNNPLVNLGLWGLKVGNGGSTDAALYLTAGGADEGSGVFARIAAIPEPGTLALLALGLVALAIWRKR